MDNFNYKNIIFLLLIAMTKNYVKNIFKKKFYSF